MPNWCYNELRIEGASDEIKRFMAASTGLPARYALSEWEIKRGYQYPTEPRFCFNALVPTPPEVLELGFDGHMRLKQLLEEQGEKAIAGKIDGYHWNCQNWGTKWDIYGDNLTLETCCWEDGDTDLLLPFETAWSPPIPWLTAVASMFPNLLFSLHYEEVGSFFAGDIICEGDSVIEDEYDVDRCRQLFECSEDDE